MSTSNFINRFIHYFDRECVPAQFSISVNVQGDRRFSTFVFSSRIEYEEIRGHFIRNGLRFDAIGESLPELFDWLRIHSRTV